MNILFFDIDGTLITNDEARIFPEDAKKAIADCRAAGNLAFINTGRVYCNIDPFIRAAGFDGYVCGCGSHIIYNGEELYHKGLDREICREIAYKCRDFKMNALFEYKDYTCFDKEMDSPDRDILVRYFSSGGKKLVDDIEDPDFVFDKFSSWYTSESSLDDFKKYISKYFSYIDREGDFCELEPIGHSKATGIKFLLDYFGIQSDNAFVFGDGNNDLEMMKYVKHSICMKNGSEAARQAAEYITDDVLSGGIKKAMMNYGLL